MQPHEHQQPIDDRGEWLEEDQPLPPRPRRRLLTPLPLSLLAVLLIACGFIGGVLVEKGQGGSSGGSGAGGSGFATRLRGLAGASSGSGSAAAARLAAGGASGGSSSAASGFTRPDTGTVSYVSGDTLYVTNSESNTVKVATSAATTVTKTVKTAVKGIHPGETVVITGATAADGTIKAESIRVGSLGGAAGGLAGLFGGGSGSTAGGKAGTGSGSSSSSGPALFGSG